MSILKHIDFEVPVWGELAGGPVSTPGYREHVLDDDPEGYWRLGETAGTVAADETGHGLDGTYVGTYALDQTGALAYDDDRAVDFISGRVEIGDTGAGSRLDFGNGEEITVHVWVDMTSIGGSDQQYVIGKGRTVNPSSNQNWSLRIIPPSPNKTGVSFLYRNSGNTGWHRWNQSSAGPATGTGFHHYAFTFTFGLGGTAKGYVDGQAVTGSWNLGNGNEAPFQDNDGCWIGNSQGGTSSPAILVGVVDEVVVCRSTLSAARIAELYELGKGALRV